MKIKVIFVLCDMNSENMCRFLLLLPTSSQVRGAGHKKTEARIAVITGATDLQG